MKYIYIPLTALLVVLLLAIAAPEAPSMFHKKAAKEQALKMCIGKAKSTCDEEAKNQCKDKSGIAKTACETAAKEACMAAAKKACEKTAG